MSEGNQRLGAQTPHPNSADYAALAEMAYRRAPDANSLHIDNIKSVNAVNLLDSPQLQQAANAWREGETVETYLRDQYGLTVDPVDRGDGLTHVYTQNGFSGYVAIRDNDTPDPSDDQFIVTYRGTDIADNAEGEMFDGITAAARPLVGPALTGNVTINGARNLHPSPEDYRAAIAEATGEPFEDFTVTRDATGRVIERLVDAGDIYTNGLLGQGTYQETQYDDASALFDLVNKDLATQGQDIVTNGQSLGGGLAALVGVENGVESHTFGMAPFQRQFEIIGQRNAVRSLLTDPETAEKFGVRAESYATANVPERHRIERELSDTLSGLRTDRAGHAGQTATRKINEFNADNEADIDRDIIREFRHRASENAAEYEGNKSELYASTVAGEFTTNSGDGSLLGKFVESGAEQIIPTEDLFTYDVGDNQNDDRIGDIRRTEADGDRLFPWTGQGETLGARGLGEGLSTHSPALHDLVTQSQGTEIGGFNQLLADNPNLRYSILHHSNIAGGVTSGKVGADTDPSASQSISTSNETFYRALSNSVRSDGALYDDTYQFFDTLGKEGRGADGADIEDSSLPSLNGAITQFALQDLKIRTIGQAPGQTLTGEQSLGGINDGLVFFDVENLEPENDLNRETGAGGIPIAGRRGIHGYSDLQTVFYNEIRDQLTVPDDKGFFERGAVATARIADEITGAQLAFRNLGFTEGKLTIPDGSLEYGYVFVESGKITGTDWSLPEPGGNDDPFKLGSAIFLGDGDNEVFGSSRSDLVSLGGGDDGYVSSVEGGAIISAGTGIDEYSLQAGTGPVFATVNENYLRVGQMKDRGRTDIDPQTEMDTAVGVERVTLSDKSDVIVMEGVSDGVLLDGAGGRNYVDYRALDRDFRLDVTDGVLPTGEAYTSRLTDGEQSYYFINIADEDIRRRAVPDAELDRASETQPKTTNSEISLEQAARQMDSDYPAVQDEIAARSTAGNLTLEDAQLGKLLAQSGTPQIFNSLQQAGISSLNIPDNDVSTASARMRATLSSGIQALKDNDLPFPESEYVPERDMTGLSNSAVETAVAIGGAKGEAILRQSAEDESVELQGTLTAEIGTQDDEHDVSVFG